VCNNIVPKDNKISKTKFTILGILIFSDVLFLTAFIEVNPNIANLLSVIIILLLLILFYKKNIIDAFSGFFLAHFLATITTYFIVTTYEHYISNQNIGLSSEISMILFVYMPLFLSYPLFYAFRKHIFNVGIFLRSLKHSIIIIQIMTYALLFINILYVDLITKDISPVFKSFLYIIAFMTFIFAAIYFAKINEKSKEVEMLNEALNNKINELKKIKHDHGSEISSIYGLYQLGRMDKLGELLKSIVERNQTFTPAVSVDIESNPLVDSVLNTAASRGITVVNLDGADYENMPLTEVELMKLVSNIIKNSIDALVNTENPTIKYNSYNSSEGIVIMISNNGPDIPQEIRNKIFEMGFSTKGNSTGDRGFGLSIVMDILKRYNGKISIRNNREFVQFIIEIPCKAS
jgi:signal transduction histidine kinase